jgi:DNA-binding transcriptional LysR family regulator
VRFSILSRTSAEILAMMENLDIDAGLSYLDNEPLGRVVTVPIYRERYVLVCRADSDLAAKTRVAWARSGGAAAVPSDAGHAEPAHHQPELHGRRCHAEAQVESNSTLVLASHVREGDWLTILPSDMAEMLAGAPDMCVRPMAEQTAQHTVGLIAPHREPHTPVLEALLSEARHLAKTVKPDATPGRGA